jgi:orotate phosphoribosyltransferase
MAQAETDVPVAESALFQRGDFTLASGQKATWKIECDALTPADWHGLAAMLLDYLPYQFAAVYGVPRGGVPLAHALRPFCVHPTVSSVVLVVDDVWTTGGSMQRFIDADVQRLMTRGAIGRAVVFARNPVPAGVTALFSVPATRAGEGES